MKKYLIFIIIIIFKLNIFCQDYKKLIREDVFWDIALSDPAYICSGYSDYAPNRYFFSGDTTIDGKIYAKMYRNQFIPTLPGPICPPFIIDTNNFLWDAFMREDTVLKRVYKYTDEDKLLYDFSLQQGDTLYPSGEYSIIIDTIINIITYDGVTRKKFYVNSWGGKYEFQGYYIEDVGGSQGPFHEPVGCFEWCNWIMCVKVNNDIIYNDGNACFNYVNIKNLSSGQLFNIYPNPNPGNFTMILSGINDEDYSFKITNIIGETVFNIKNVRTKVVMIDISDQSKGTYIINVQAGNKVFTEKIIYR